MISNVLCQQGFPDELRTQAAALYDSAFGAKLSLAIPDANRRIALLAEAFLPEFAYIALSEGQLVGIVGFKSVSGALTGGMSLARLYSHLGTFGALRAILVLALYNRTRARDQLLMDGIAVAPSMRGKGVGSLLLRELQAFARTSGYKSLRLDVIDTNPDARRLYKRMGFIATRTTRFGYLRWLFGFGAATTMEHPLTGVPTSHLPRWSWRRRLAIGAGMLVLAAAGCLVWVVRQHSFDIDTSEITFTHNGHKIVGTLATPRGPGSHGLVVFVHGDGPMHADGDGGYPAIWESFARAGYASLAWDQPGVGRSDGDWESYSMSDRADLALAALDAVIGRPDIDSARIGLWGASQAGWVLPKIANRRAGVRFIIAVAPAINWSDQGRFNELQELAKKGASEAQIAAAVAYSDALRSLLDRNATYDEYLALAPAAIRVSGHYDQPMSERRWRFAAINYRSDARADLAALPDMPVLLQIAGQDRNVDATETEAVYRGLLGNHLQVRRYQNAHHSMVRANIEVGSLRFWATALFAIRELYADGFLADGKAFLDSLPTRSEEVRGNSAAPKHPAKARPARSDDGRVAS